MKKEKTQKLTPEQSKLADVCGQVAALREAFIEHCRERPPCSEGMVQAVKPPRPPKELMHIIDDQIGAIDLLQAALSRLEDKLLPLMVDVASYMVEVPDRCTSDIPVHANLLQAISHIQVLTAIIDKMTEQLRI